MDAECDSASERHSAVFLELMTLTGRNWKASSINLKTVHQTRNRSSEDYEKSLSYMFSIFLSCFALFR